MVIEKKKPMESVKNVFLKIGKRNLIIALAVLLVGSAILVNWIIFADDDGKYDGYDVSSGMSNSYGDAESAGKTDDFFASTQISRERARDEALEVLQAVVDSADSSEVAKNEALESIAAIANEIQKEANIESLITAKGFEQCVAVLNGDAASIVVKAETLQPADIAQINTIVYEQTGIAPTGITIINK